MIILLAKAYQPALLEKIVPVAGSVSKEGVITKPHYARRKVKAPEAQTVETPKATEPAPQKKTKKEVAREQAAVGDLFDMPAAKEPPKAEEPKPEPQAEAKPAKPRAPRKAKASKPAPAAAVNYDAPFDPAKVPAFGVPAGTSRDARRAINAECIALLDNAPVPADKLPILRQYSGNGGCGDSLNEFYTDSKVAAAMWRVLRDLGLPEGAEVLEPSCATGVFLETAPAGVRVVGVEMDPTSAEIGKVLHPAHEVQNASLERFATQDARQFDAVVGNAPFGLRGSLIKDDKSNLKTAEAYFMDTSLDKTKPGGIVAMIVPTGIMDSNRDRKVRENLLRKGEFLGAMRMPNTAFEHSHTEVTTDILFFRKRPQDVANALMTVKQGVLQKLGVWDDEYLAGGYFTGRGAKNIMGTMTEGWRAKAGMGDDITVEGSMTGVPAAIAEFKPEIQDAKIDMAAVLEAIGPDEDAKAKARGAALRMPYDTAKRGDRKVVDGVEYILEGDPLRWHRVDEFLQSETVTAGQALAQEIENRLNGYVMGGLEDRVRAYIEKFGNPSKNWELQLAAHTDKTIYRLIGAVKPDGSLSDAITGHKAAVVESSFDAAAQTLSLEVGYFTPEMVAGRWGGGDSETALDHLYASPDYALDPASRTWTSVDNYLSGELWPKLDAAKAAAADEAKPEDKAKFERQANLLEETIAPKLLEDVEVAVNSAFLPLPILAAYFNEKKAEMAAEGNSWVAERPDLVITFDKGIYKLTGGLYDTGLLEKYLNRTGVKKDDLPQIDKWNVEFKAWLCSSKYRDEVEDLYNRKFRGFRQRAYSETPLDVPGLNAEGLKSYQWAGLRWALEAGKGIVAADVGLGKTARGLILARLAKTTGRAKRPMIIVPKSVLANWLAEAERWFPGCSVMTIGETYTKDKDGKLKGRQDTAAERNRKYHDITQNDYDFILISQPAWNDLDVDPETKFNYSEGDFWVQRGDALGNAGDKRINKIRESYKQHMAQREFQRRTDAIYFNDLGVDMVIGDEFHAYKNLYAARNRFGQSPKFLGGQGLSNRALDMNFKTRWVREQNLGKGVYGLTATPTKNSPLEVYSMLSHIAPEAFEQIGVRNSEEFLDRFCEFKTENILTTTGKIEEALVTVGFKNLDELREIMRRYIDRKTAEDVGLILPERDDRMHTVEMTAEQKKVYATLRALAEQAAKKKDSKGDAHIFSIMDKMAKAAMDLELYDPKYKGATSPKYVEAAAHISEGAKDGGQVVFAENIAVHDKLVAALVKRGIPRERIAVFNAQVAESSAKRQGISDDFNAGKLDVVIGNSTMSEGVNLQKRTTDIHHMDLPWEPASVQQRNGRGLRQGNTNESVRIHTYLAKGSFDGYKYQTLAAKKSWQDLLWNGGDRVENLAREGNISLDDMLIMLSADPEEARAKMESNKVLAKKKFEAEKYSAAAAEFVSFQEMKRSYSGLKNKHTASAERLRVRMDRTKTGLEANDWFKAKHALDSKNPVMLDPQTGTAFENGVAFEAPETVNGGGKYVVTGVHPMEGTIQVRRYGEANAHPLSFTMDMLKDGIKSFQYDESAEKAEISRSLEEAMKSKASAISGPKDLHGLPAAVIESSYEPIQKQLKDGFREYKWSSHGGVGLIKNGRPVAAESYDAHKMLDDHDMLIPVPAHHKAAMAAYVEDERAKEFRMEYQTSGGRRGSHKSTQIFKTNYPGKYGQASNRWANIGDSVFGKGFEKEAQAVFERAQNEAGRRAKSFGEALDAVAPTVDVQWGRVKWPKRGLAVLFARAKKDGVLDQPLSSLVPLKGGSGWDKSRPRWPEELFAGRERAHHDANTKVGGMPARKALAKIAEFNGYKDLAAAMLGHGGGEGAAKELLGLQTHDKHVADGLRHVISKEPALGARPMEQLMSYPRRPDGETLSQYLEAIEANDEEGERDAA